MFLRIGLFSALAGAALASAQASVPSFDAGEAAYIAGKLDEARAIYAAAGASAANAKDRAASLRQLGVMAWRLDGDNATAERRFGEALKVGADLSRTHIERARFYATIGRFAEAIAAGEAALATATNATEQADAALSFARAALDQLQGAPVSAQTRDAQAHLTRARDVIFPLAQTPPLNLDLSEALLEIALRLDDGPLALLAWRSYAREGIDVGAWAPAGRQLSAALPNWRRGAPMPALRREVFEALATSHFFDLAVMVAKDDRVAGKDEFLREKRVSDVAIYTAMMTGLRKSTETYYRDIANRKAAPDAWRGSLIKRAQEAWANLSFDVERPAFALDRFIPVIEQRFGAYVSIGKTGDVEDMHYAHIFLDDARTIEQYGRRAQIRRIALDRVVSNGYESWLWDGRQAHGGWARADRVYQVRPRYADGALKEWDRLTHPARRAEEEERIARLTASDDEIARKRAAAYLPGLAVRLDWQGLSAVVAQLQAKGARGADLKERFIVDYNRIGLDANFFAHEGRHVLDKQALGGNVPSDELEFRAKLSEIAFSEQPRLSFGPIVSPNIDDSTSAHGRANKRIMQGLVAWMEKHRGAIAGLDTARPLLPQFDKLSDEQMRTAMRAMDPWAPKP